MGKRGVKTCPTCSTENGPRAFKCKKCSHDFKPGQEPKPAVVLGIGRGQKLCPQCSKTCGPRSYTCPHCRFEFKAGGTVAEAKPAKKLKRKNKCHVTDWKALEIGNRIKVLQGTGDYYISKESGERVYMQDPGLYKIEGVNEDGLVVQGRNGHGFIYMGESKVSKTLASIHKEAAKILLFIDR